EDQSSTASADGDAGEKQDENLDLFRFQVGGNKPMLVTRPGTVLKPLVPSELRFYQHAINNLPSLLPFMPGFFGKQPFVQEDQSAGHAEGSSNLRTATSVSPLLQAAVSSSMRSLGQVSRSVDNPDDGLPQDGGTGKQALKPAAADCSDAERSPPLGGKQF